MTPLSVVFIEPSGNRANVFDNYMRLPLMGSLYLGSILHRRGHHVRILNENIRGARIDPFEIRADVFCLTALTVSATRARFLAAQLKRAHPDSRVLIGGIHATLLPEEFTDVADHVVTGEAENIIVDLVEGRLSEPILAGSPVADLNLLPPIHYGLLENADRFTTIPLMTSRGCPFDCNFCTVTKIFGRRFRMLSAPRIINEIQNALPHFSSRNFFFYDDNFTANRKRVEEFCDLLAKERLEIYWAAQVRADLARHPDLVARMADAGLRWVYVGFESIDDETLSSLHKSQTRADIEHAIQTFHHHGINVHGMFMFGEDHDTVPTISRTVDFAIEHQIDTTQFLILTPFPGTQIHDKLVGEGRLFHRNWSYYNAMFPVFRPRQMAALTLAQETYAAYHRFYSLRRTFLDSLFLVVRIALDALVWNFHRAHQYSLDTMFLRGGARSLVHKYKSRFLAYLNYLAEMDAEKLSSGATEMLARDIDSGPQNIVDGPGGRPHNRPA